MLGGYSSHMKTAGVADLKNRLSYFLRIVSRGETVTVLDRGKPIAQLTPPGETSDELQKLAQTGMARLPLRTAPRDLWTRRLARSTQSVSDALHEDRDDRLS